MRKDDVVNLFLNKCRELGGTPKLENSPHSPLLGCQLSSLKNGMELSRFAEKIEVPKDATVIIFFITGMEKTETCDIDFLHVEKKYKGGRSSHIDISLNFPRVIPENMYESLDKEVRGIVERELGDLRGKAIVSSSVYKLIGQAIAQISMYNLWLLLPKFSGNSFITSSGTLSAFFILSFNISALLSLSISAGMMDL
jgi:hypothetical protein